MKKDDTIRKIIGEVVEDLRVVYGKEFSPKEVDDIVSSQFIGAVAQLSKGINVSLPYLGKLVTADKKALNLSVGELNKLREFYSDIEFKQRILKAKIKTIEANKERWKREREAKKIPVMNMIRMPKIGKDTRPIIGDKLNELIPDGE